MKPYTAARPFRPRRRLRRVEPGAVRKPSGTAEWDRILTENVDVPADALREAEGIAEDSTLMHLGVQGDNIDLVLAEATRRETRVRRGRRAARLSELSSRGGAVGSVCVAA